MLFEALPASGVPSRLGKIRQPKGWKVDEDDGPKEQADGVLGVLAAVDEGGWGVEVRLEEDDFFVCRRRLSSGHELRAGRGVGRQVVQSCTGDSTLTYVLPAFHRAKRTVRVLLPQAPQ